MYRIILLFFLSLTVELLAVTVNILLTIVSLHILFNFCNISFFFLVFVFEHKAFHVLYKFAFKIWYQIPELLIIFFIYLYLCVNLCASNTCWYPSIEAKEYQILDSCERPDRGMLGNESRSSARAVNLWAASLALQLIFRMNLMWTLYRIN